MENSQSISLENIKAFRDSYASSAMSQVATRAVSKTDISDVCYDTQHAQKMNHKFSVDIPTLPATNQKSSGRCWIFSSLNILREKIAKDLNLEEFELSQNFVSFFDHLEKSNSFLEHIIETASAPLDDRLVRSYLSYPVGDGGWWEYFVGLCVKYGLVPKEAMTETHQSSDTATMNDLLNLQLQKDAMVLRKAIADKADPSAVHAMKLDMLKQVYNLLAICLGNPPETFDFEYVDKDKKYHVDRNLTPHAFYDKYIGRDVENIVSLINAPTPTRPFNQTYVIAHDESVYGVSPVKFLNVPIEEMKAAIIRQLQNNDLVWFACDCHPYRNRDEGIWDTGLYDYETPFGLDYDMSKGDRLECHQNFPNHAMVLTGVNLVDGKPDKWKVQNSWGTEKANKGYFIMSDAWFDKFVFTASIDKKYLTEAQLENFQKEPIVVEPWNFPA